MTLPETVERPRAAKLRAILATHAPLIQSLVILALLAVAVRLRYLFIFELNPPIEHVFSDMEGFLRRAQRLIEGRFVRSDTLFAPGQHLLVAASAVLLDGYDTLVRWVHLAAGVFTCYWVTAAAERLIGRKGALTTLVLCVFHFPFIALGGYYLAETVFTAILAVLFLLMSKTAFPWPSRLATAIGATAGLGLVWKGTNVFFLPILALWSIGWYARASADSACRAWRCWCYLLLGFFIVIGSQTLYFFHFYGVPLPLAAGGGYNFAMTKCPGALIVSKDGMEFKSPTTHYTGEGGVQVWDVNFYEQSKMWKGGLECVRQNPWVVVSSVRQVSYLFRGNELWPVNAGRFEDFSARYRRRFGWIVYPGIAWALLAFAREPFAPRTTPFLLGLSVCAAAWLFMGEMRFRIPFDVVFIPMSVLGWKWGATTVLGDRAHPYIDPALILACLLTLAMPVVQELL